MLNPIENLPVKAFIYPGGRNVNMLVDEYDGSYYLEADVEGILGTGPDYWTKNGIFARLGKADQYGNWLWMVGEKAPGFVKPGQFYKIGNIAGISQDCLFVTDINGQVRVFDKDNGLYVGSLFSDSYKGVVPDENLNAIELNEAHAFTHPTTGGSYVVLGDCTGLKIFQVTGLTGIEKFSGVISVPGTILMECEDFVTKEGMTVRTNDVYGKDGAYIEDSFVVGAGFIGNYSITFAGMDDVG